MDMLDRLNVDKFKEINNYELLQIVGGVSISGALISAFTKAITTALDVGRSLGTALKRIITKKLCPAK